jgi:hypothetical protein
MWTSAVDPNSIGSLDPNPDPDSQSGSGSRRAKITYKHSLVCTITLKITKLNRITYFFEYEIRQVLAEGFSCSLDMSKLQFLIQKRKRNFCCIFLLFLVIKTLDPDWIRIRIRIRIHLKCWIRPYSDPDEYHSSDVDICNANLCKKILCI